MAVPTPCLATAEISSSFSVMAVAGCGYKTAVLAQVSCGSFMSEVCQGDVKVRCGAL